MTGKARASSTKTYTAVTSFNEFEAGHTYEMRETDAKVWVDMGHLRLASDEARWVTGQVLVVDGGLSMTTR